MLSMAAIHGMGVALIPPMLIESELARGELRIVCNRPMRGKRGYYLVTADSRDERPAVTHFRQWLTAQARGATA